MDLAAAERYLAAEEIGAFTGTAAPRSTQLEDRYVDTADGALGRAGFAVRLRQSGRGTIVSVKSTSRTEGAGGSVRREELEGPADRTAGPLDWPASDARSLILELAGDAPLLELVTIRQLRRKRIVRDGDTRVELSLDEVDVVSRSRVIDRFVELEAELVKGAEERLAGLAEVFAADPALAPATGSKLEAAMAAVKSGGRPRGPSDADDDPGHGRGRRRTRDGRRCRPAVRAPDPAWCSGGPSDEDSVRRGSPRDDRDRERARRARRGRSAPSIRRRPRRTAPHEGHEHADATPSTSDVVSEVIDEAIPPDLRLVVGRTPGVTPEDHVAEAGRKVMRFHLARMLAREAGRAPATTPRSCTRCASRPGGSAPPGASSVPRSGRVGRGATGTACARSHRGSAPCATSTSCSKPPISIGRTCPSASSERSNRCCPSGAGIATTRGSCSSASWIRTDTAAGSTTTATSSGPRAQLVMPVGPTQPHRVRDTTASRVWTAYEQVRGYEPVLRWADVETLHELRIAGKWLRYTLEFVREALGDDAGPLIARVTALQDHLGLMNDADVASSMARTFLVEHAGELSPLEGAAIGRYLVSREREVARLRRTIGAPWRGVSGVTFRRTLGRVVARPVALDGTRRL